MPAPFIWCYENVASVSDLLGAASARKNRLFPGASRADPGLGKLCWAHGRSAPRQRRREAPGGSAAGAAESLEGPGIWDSDPLLWERPWASEQNTSMIMEGHGWMLIVRKIIWLKWSGGVSGKASLITGGPIAKVKKGNWCGLPKLMYN